MPKTFNKDYSGQVFGRLSVVSFIPTSGRYSTWMCRCECGNDKSVKIQALLSGQTVSCGCYNKEVLHNQATHGESGNKTRSGAYSSWANMMMRCEWGGHPSYDIYGAKGIRVCKSWFEFENFKKDMGERPKSKSIDRIDNTKGYFPGNCRWATRREQALNTSRTVKVLIDGKIEVVFNLYDRISISSKALRSRASRRGNDYVKALRSIGIDCDYINV